MARYLDHDPVSGAVETFDYDENDDLCIVRRYCDVQPVLDRNKNYHLDNPEGWVGPGRNMRLAARIPEIVALKWLQEYGISCWKAEHWPAVRKLLNDPDWRHLRPTSFSL